MDKLLLFFCFITFVSFSQSELKELGEVFVSDFSKRTNLLEFSLSKEEIKKQQAEDLGDLIKGLPGVSLKNYGGLGGLKTISTRGINGVHAGVILDGFLIQNTQTSLIDLSHIHTENTNQVQLSYGLNEQKLQQVGAYFNISNLILTSFEHSFSPDTIQLRASLKGGSFANKEVFLAMKINRKNHFFAVNMRYRSVLGNFPYQLQNAEQLISANRTNADLRDINSSVTFGLKLGKNKILTNTVHYFNTNRGVPGAVILYTTFPSQRIQVESIQFNSNLFIKRLNSKSRVYTSLRSENLVYKDSSVLNATHYLESQYVNQYALLGFIQNRMIHNWTMTYGIEEQVSQLTGSNFVGQIQRFHTKALSEWSLKATTFQYDLTLTYQHCLSIDYQKATSYQSINPSFKASTFKQLPFFGLMSFAFRQNKRIPSFNELYYNQIGSIELLPEKVISLVYTFENNLKINAFNFEYTYSLFNNYIKDKIIAIPTKNLFIWSIQNVGKVLIFGNDIQLRGSYAFAKMKWDLHATYTYQKAMDITNPDGKTYMHQVAYIPKHSAQLTSSISALNKGLQLSLFVNGGSFALNQNISANFVAPFYVVDASVWQTLNWKKNDFRIQFSIKNALNQSYQYIMNYVMPGRNYLITLNYALH